MTTKDKGSKMSVYTVEIQASNTDGTTWQALAPAETIDTATVAAHRGYGTLYDMTTYEKIGPATKEQREASDAGGETGAFVIDRDGDPCHQSADPQVFGPLRTVYVQP